MIVKKMDLYIVIQKMDHRFKCKTAQTLEDIIEENLGRSLW